MDNSIDCIIPAKANSQRLPEKNKLTFGGVSSLALVIGELQKSGIFHNENIYVDTDSPAIALDAINMGVQATQRDPKLALPGVGVEEVVVRVLDSLKNQRAFEGVPQYEYVCIVYPLAWGLGSTDLSTMYHLLKLQGVDGVMGVVRPLEHPMGAMEEVPGHNGMVLRPINTPKPSEQWPDLLMDAGYAYMYRVDKFRKYGFYPPNLVPHRLPRHAVVDIDTLDEYRMAHYIVSGMVVEVEADEDDEEEGEEGLIFNPEEHLN